MRAGCRCRRDARIDRGVDKCTRRGPTDFEFGHERAVSQQYAAPSARLSARERRLVGAPHRFVQRRGGGAEVLLQLGGVEAADRVAVDALLAQAELQGELQQVDPTVAAPLPARTGRGNVIFVPVVAELRGRGRVAAGQQPRRRIDQPFMTPSAGRGRRRKHAVGGALPQQVVVAEAEQEVDVAGGDRLAVELVRAHAVADVAHQAARP